MTVNGFPGQGPLRAGSRSPTSRRGLMAAHGVLVALLERERSGRGQWVHTSLLQAMIRLMDLQAARWLIGGEVPGPGRQLPSRSACRRACSAAGTASLIIQAANKRLYQRLCRAHRRAGADRRPPVLRRATSGEVTARR